ncbi:helix-turn-helix transcriptional regulator [Magnetospirillum sp. 15-1]|uniref:helix-turn-helix domain-containing protein n=1 Tax=Magnetospirillum sp. 15-1 TaxID=1979370 RepID=UPI001F5B7431|nr:helix-turn-helix transcriptional regulator [Magnetospirillum sp. 15-1]
MKRTIGRRLRTAREQADLTQEALAERIERSPEAVSNIERGVSLPTLDTLDRIAAALDAPLVYFLDAPPESIAPGRAEVEARARLLLRALSDRDADIALGVLQLLHDGGRPRHQAGRGRGAAGPHGRPGRRLRAEPGARLRCGPAIPG